MADLTAYLPIVQGLRVPGPLFWVALTLVAGALLGESVYRGLGLPRIVGYGLAGMGVAWTGSSPALLPGDLRLVVDLALALLLFELGSRVSLRWLRANTALLGASVLEAGACFAAVAAVLHTLGFAGPVALAGAAITLPASGAMAGCVAAEFKAAGQVTERMRVLAALNTLYAVLALTLVVAWRHLNHHGAWLHGISWTLYTVAGSLLVAAALQLAVRGVMRRFDLRNEHGVLLLLGLLLLALSVVRMLALSTLLVPLLAGVMLRNTSDRPCVWPCYFGTAGGVLVLMMFVVMGRASAGALLAPGITAGLALLLARLGARALVLGGTARWTGIEVRQGLALAVTLTPLSATTLVLLADLQAAHPDIAAPLIPAALAAIATMVLLGPVLVQAGLRWGRDLGPATDVASGAATAVVARTSP